MNVNKVLLIGRLTAPVELRKTQTGQSVASFRIATNNFWTSKDGQKQEKTEFHSIVLWGKLADIAEQYLVKGQEVYIEGRIESRKYTKKDGTEGSATDIIGEVMQLGARPQGNDHVERDTTKPSVAKPDDDIPTIEL